MQFFKLQDFLQLSNCPDSNSKPVLSLSGKQFRREQLIKGSLLLMRPFFIGIRILLFFNPFFNSLRANASQSQFILFVEAIQIVGKPACFSDLLELGYCNISQFLKGIYPFFGNANFKILFLWTFDLYFWLTGFICGKNSTS